MFAKFSILPCLLHCLLTAQPLCSDAPDVHETQPPSLVQTKEPESFTGKVIKNRVRLRMQPNLEAPILKELQKDDYVVVSGLSDDFYATLPPANMKGYVFRTYVLDNVVEGNHVNVRLEPDTNAPILCQLNTGDKVEGAISSLHSKWLEINLPESVRFYVAKEFVQNIGDKNLYLELERRKKRLQENLGHVEKNMSEELKKPFRDIQLAPLAATLNQIISQNQDLPQQVEKSHELLQKMQEAYLQRSIGMKQDVKHDVKSNAVAQDYQGNDNDPTDTLHRHAEPKKENYVPITPEAPALPDDFKDRESAFVHAKIDRDQDLTEALYYMQELEKGQKLQGVIKPNVRMVRNAPGDYVLVDAKTQLPKAYLYSTHIDLQPLCGKQVYVCVSERPDNNFAFKAYFVLRVEQ